MPSKKPIVSPLWLKMFEETVRGSLSELVAHFTEKGVKGEFVVVVQGKA